MKTTIKSLSWLALAALSGTLGCVSTRPSRNGVFNENQYVRKDFLVAPGDGTVPDEGWIMQVTVTATSTPNPLGFVNGAGLFAGAQSGGPNYVRFGITEDKLQLIDLREISNDPTQNAQNLRTPQIINAWPITNVDLKYRINLDGEITNFYEENQELDWQVRQWVKLNFGKNDMSDLYAFGANTNPVITKCTNMIDASATLIPNSFVVDTQNGYMEFGISLTVPIAYADADAATCAQAFGPAGVNFARLNRQNVTLNLLYSFVRPSKIPGSPLDSSYTPLQLAEKDPIRHKYGAFEFQSTFRDPNTGLLGAQQMVMRFNPQKDIVYYFAPGVPEAYKTYFAGSDGNGGVVKATNDILARAGTPGRLKILNFDDDKNYGKHELKNNPRHIGDVRYSFITWHSDLDNGSGLLGIAQFTTDPRTGQTISATVNVFEGPFKDTIAQRLDLFLRTVGLEYLTKDGSDFDDSKYPQTCQDGDITPLVPADVSAKLNARSTVYGKMQTYMQKPVAQWGNLGPADFLPNHAKDFYDAYFAIIPYQVYADPQANPFVQPDGSTFSTPAVKNWEGLQKLAQFESWASEIDHGNGGWDDSVEGTKGVESAVAYNHKLSDALNNLVEYNHIKARQPIHAQADDLSLFSYFDIYQKNGRHCVGGKWESRQNYLTRLITSLNGATALHEFGHTLGLRHNFMGSVDQRNYATDGSGHISLFASSIMDYNQQINEAFFDPGTTGWPPYDAATIGFIYGNSLSADKVGPQPAMGTPAGISGQITATVPWNDPIGFDKNNPNALANGEVPFLYCTDEHLAYTPLCKQYDMGATPAEIMANAIQQREWNYLWTNFRLYHKYFDLSSYTTQVGTQFTDFRRFTSMWFFDMSPSELLNTLRLVGITPPPGTNAADFYNQITAKFNEDMSVANQLAASYHRAIVDQASGERPFITVFDPFYGDTTQQGIQIDKAIALNGYTALWPAISNFDPSQAGAFQLSNAYGQDGVFQTVSSGTILDFLGAAFATYRYAQLGPIISYAEATHDSRFMGPLSMQQWIGGQVFERERDLLDYLHSMAVKAQFQNCDENGLNCKPCTSLDQCTWDPRQYRVKPSQLTQSDKYNNFQGPDGRSYIWGYLQSRNQWVVADKQRNVAMYTVLYNWASLLVAGEDNGDNGSVTAEQTVRYMVDAFKYYDNNQTATP